MDATLVIYNITKLIAGLTSRLKRKRFESFMFMLWTIKRKKVKPNNPLSSDERAILTDYFQRIAATKYAINPHEKHELEIMFTADHRASSGSPEHLEPKNFIVYSADPSYMPLAWDGMEEEWHNQTDWFFKLDKNFTSLELNSEPSPKQSQNVNANADQKKPKSTAMDLVDAIIENALEKRSKGRLEQLVDAFIAHPHKFGIRLKSNDYCRLWFEDGGTEKFEKFLVNLCERAYPISLKYNAGEFGDHLTQDIGEYGNGRLNLSMFDSSPNPFGGADLVRGYNEGEYWRYIAITKKGGPEGKWWVALENRIADGVATLDFRYFMNPIHHDEYSAYKSVWEEIGAKFIDKKKFPEYVLDIPPTQKFYRGKWRGVGQRKKRFLFFEYCEKGDTFLE